MPLPTDLPTLTFPSQAAWEQWLEQNHGSAPGLWLQIAKKSSGIATVTYDEAVESALCFGWIDGQKGALDQTYFLQRFTPRRPRSLWSQINTRRIEVLETAGRMRPAGQREVAAAKADGRWDAAYQGARDATVPADLAEALRQDPAAERFFTTLDKTHRYAVCFRVQTAVKPQTRADRIARFVSMLARGEKLHP
jgi:uncharacterized protein YdeI (YjbR/CyaY-like superfamily)